MNEKRKKMVIVGVVLAVVIIVVVGAVLTVLHSGSTVKQEYTALEQIDVNGMTVGAACEKLREKGWQILEVLGKNDSKIKSDCSDKNHKVASVLYYKEKYHVSNGDPDDRYEKVRIYFNDQDGMDTGASTGNDLSSSSNNSSSSDMSFRKAMDDYESFMNRYVDFMKKYKNSSDVTSMLAEYSTMMQDYAKFADSIKGYNQDNLSASDWAYYLEVTTRVTKKLAEVQ